MESFSRRKLGIPVSFLNKRQAYEPLNTPLAVDHPEAGHQKG